MATPRRRDRRIAVDSARRRVAAASRRAGRVFTPERLTDEHRLIARTTDGVRRQRSAAGLDRLEQKDWALARQLAAARAASSGCSASTSPKRTAALAARQGHVARRQREDGAVGVVRRRRSARRRTSTIAAAVAVRHRRAEAEVPAAADDRRDRRRLRLSESGSGSDALGAQDASRRGRPTAASS